MSDPSPRFRVLVADAISEDGVERLRASPGIEAIVRTGLAPDELARELRDVDGLIVRSATKVTAESLGKPGRLKVIGRAGTGVDNIDLDAATRAGVVVMNTPGGNSVAAAELTMTLLLALCRNVSQANEELRAGRWERKKYMGVEVAGKTLGVVGLGKIGLEVARRARAFRMEIVGFDPFVSNEVARAAGVRCVELDELAAVADVLTLHVPRTDETRNLIDAAMLAKMKPGVRIINCARGGLVDEKALLDAIESGHVAGAALDVFDKEPPEDTRLVNHPHVVCTPHLGASTREAQVRVGIEIAEKLRDYLHEGVILDAVNFPAIDREEYARVGPVMDLAERLGGFLGQIADGGFRALRIRVSGSFGEHPLRPIAMAAARGLLAPVVEGVSHVNSLEIARARKIEVEESRGSDPGRYAGAIRMTLETDKGRVAVAGTLAEPAEARLVEVDGVPIESFPDGHMLFLRNHDRPGVVGAIGTLLGRAGVNIAGFQLGRSGSGSEAVSIINVDDEVPDAVLSEIRAVPEILDVRDVHI